MLLPQQEYVHGQEPSCLSEGMKFRFRMYLKESTQVAKHYVSDTTLDMIYVVYVLIPWLSRHSVFIISA